MAKKLMYGFGNQLVHLVWHLVNDRPTLAVICTTDEDLYRYVTGDQKEWLSGRGPVFVERVACDHLYGAHDMRIAAELIRREQP